jgi:hypothetical protein
VRHFLKEMPGTSDNKEKIMKILPKFKERIKAFEVVQRHFPKWKEEFDKILKIDYSSAKRCYFDLPFEEFKQDEKEWLRALKYRIFTLHTGLEKPTILHRKLRKMYFRLQELNENITEKVDIPEVPRYDHEKCKLEFSISSDDIKYFIDQFH